MQKKLRRKKMENGSSDSGSKIFLFVMIVAIIGGFYYLSRSKDPLTQSAQAPIARAPEVEKEETPESKVVSLPQDTLETPPKPAVPIEKKRAKFFSDMELGISNIPAQVANGKLTLPGNLAAAAAALGMVPAGNPAFLEIGADGAVQVLGSPAPASAVSRNPMRRYSRPDAAEASGQPMLMLASTSPAAMAPRPRTDCPNVGR